MVADSEMNSGDVSIITDSSRSAELAWRTSQLSPALQSVRENALVFREEIRQLNRYVTISAVQPGSSVLAAAQRERRVGRRSPEYFPAPRGGAVGQDRVREGVQRGGRRVVCADSHVEGVAVRVCAGDHECAAAGAAHPGGLGAALSGGWTAAGQLGVECVPAAARAGAERPVHAKIGK